MSTFSLAGLQLALPYGDNRERIAREVESTLRRFPWVQMVVLAELATYGPELRYAQVLQGGEAERFYCELAARLGTWLVPGSLYEQVGEAVYNTALVIDPTGEVVARYRKIYPFRPYERNVAPGSEIVVFDVPAVGRFGLSICYDGWFPETTRAMACLGATVIIHPTMTGTVDRAQELVIAQANAIVNQCYFVDINNAGLLGNGRSIVVGPEGDVLHQAGELNEVIPLTLDLDRVARVRRDGIKGLGQVLKSFRDTPMVFGCYNGAAPACGYLDSLGPLEVPARALPDPLAGC
jgi:predicted amidohydrolase